MKVDNCSFRLILDALKFNNSVRFLSSSFSASCSGVSLTTTGSGSHILHVNTEDSSSLEKLLRIIQSWPGVKRTETQLILSSYKKSNPLTFRVKEEVND